MILLFQNVFAAPAGVKVSGPKGDLSKELVVNYTGTLTREVKDRLETLARLIKIMEKNYPGYLSNLGALDDQMLAGMWSYRIYGKIEGETSEQEYIRARQYIKGKPEEGVKGLEDDMGVRGTGYPKLLLTIEFSGENEPTYYLGMRTIDYLEREISRLENEISKLPEGDAEKLAEPNAKQGNLEELKKQYVEKVRELSDYLSKFLLLKMPNDDPEFSRIYIMLDMKTGQMHEIEDYSVEMKELDEKMVELGNGFKEEFEINYAEEWQDMMGEKNSDGVLEIMDKRLRKEFKRAAKGCGLSFDEGEVAKISWEALKSGKLALIDSRGNAYELLMKTDEDGDSVFSLLPFGTRIGDEIEVWENLKVRDSYELAINKEVTLLLSEAFFVKSGTFEGFVGVDRHIIYSDFCGRGDASSVPVEIISIRVEKDTVIYLVREKKEGAE